MVDKLKGQTAFGMSYSEFCDMYEECKGFISELNKSHTNSSNGEFFMDFILDGSESLKNNISIKNNLIIVNQMNRKKKLKSLLRVTS